MVLAFMGLYRFITRFKIYEGIVANRLHAHQENQLAIHQTVMEPNSFARGGGCQILAENF